MKRQGKPGIVREVSIILYPSQGKVGENHLVHIYFSLTLCLVVCRVVFPFVVSKCDFHHFAYCCSKYCTLHTTIAYAHYLSIRVHFIYLIL